MSDTSAGDIALATQHIEVHLYLFELEAMRTDGGKV